MTKLLNLFCVAALLLAGVATAHADNRLPIVKQISLNKSADCCETAPAPAPECKTCKPCITYRGCFDCCCGPKVSQTLKVKDPCDCCCSPCCAEIPVCLPACCKNPTVCCKCGLFGRGIVTYSYDCGCCVTIVFRNCGDVIVKYDG